MWMNIYEAIYDHLIEIRATFNRLERERKIKSWNELMAYIGLDGVELTFINIAKDFEKKYPFDSEWHSGDLGDLDYVMEVQQFAEERLIKEWGELICLK